jgi:hypothetical protein
MSLPQFLAILGMFLTVIFLFLPYLRHLNRTSAVNRVLLLQFPGSLFAAATPEITAALKV